MQGFYFLGVIGAAIFISGFFPIRYDIGENINNEPPSVINNISLNDNEYYLSNISKTVIIIIDALRLDLSSKKYLPLTSKLVNENGCFCDVTAEIPTVTLPRIKSLTTGTIPQFMDIVLNLANAQVLTDSIIHSARKKHKNVVFYGDETWLKLFPNQFLRYEGTNSFFVKDFTEVDDNVTRNVNLELYKDDWDILVLHYLGLDHIGHVYGPFSPLVPIKLKEMDDIIFKIYDVLSSKYKNILMVVTSDHGMRDVGGHGGSTYGETKVPLFLIGLYCKNSSLLQFEVPTNLAVLLGLHIPSTAIGRIHLDLFEYTLQTQLYILRYNLLLLKQKRVLCDKYFETATQLHINYLMNNVEKDALEAIEMYKNCSEEISTTLMKSAVQQNVVSLVVGIMILSYALLFLVANICITNYKLCNFDLLLLSAPLIYFLTYDVIAIFLFLLILFIIKIFMISKRFYHFKNKMIFSLFLQPLIFFSSSFIEEEHQVWYFLISVIFIAEIIYHLHHQNFKSTIILVLLSVSYRFIKRINSTGDQWSNYPDISDWFLKPDNYLYYVIFITFSMITFYISLHCISHNVKKVNIYNLLVLFCIFLFKLMDSIQLGQICWLLIVSHFLLFHKNNKIISWTFIIALLVKPYNIVLTPFCIFFYLSTRKIIKYTEDVVIFQICLGNMLYFAQGHSNSLASVEISVGYTALYNYQPIIVILQVLFHTYSFPILCHLLILKTEHNKHTQIWNILFCNRFYNFLVVSVVTFVFRHHLFIWSVFAPKLFIEFVHVLFLFFQFCCYFVIKRLEFIIYNNKTVKLWDLLFFFNIEPDNFC